MKKGRIVWDPSRDAAESAREVLPQLASELFTVGRRIVESPLDIEALHQFRLRTKRFRYTLELFEPLYGPGLKKHLTQLRRLQNHLGGVNDCSVSRTLITDIQRRHRKVRKVKKVLKWLDRSEESRAEGFLSYWRETFDAPGEEDRWVRYLRAYAGRGHSREKGQPAIP